MKDLATLNIWGGVPSKENTFCVTILSDMYTNWAYQNHFFVKRQWPVFGDIESHVSLDIMGPNVLERLQKETGVHRFVFTSIFDKERRRFTTFISVNTTAGEMRDMEDWEHQIRSYVLAPYWSAKNLVNGKETDNVLGVLQGHIELLQ